MSSGVNITVDFRTNGIADLGPTSGLVVCSAARRDIPSNKTTEREMKMDGFSRSDYVIRSDRSPCSNRVDISGSDLSASARVSVPRRDERQRNVKTMPIMAVSTVRVPMPSMAIGFVAHGLARTTARRVAR